MTKDCTYKEYTKKKKR